MSETLPVAPLGTPFGIWAHVTIDVSIQTHEDHTDRIDAAVTIRATNNTLGVVSLKDPYRLPVKRTFLDKGYIGAKKNADEVIAAADKLDTIPKDDEICVYFGERKLEPKGEFIWTIEYARMSEVYLAGILSYDLFIKPQPMFQDILVQKHLFDVHVTLPAPSGTKAAMLKRWRIHQTNTLKLNPTTKYGRHSTTYLFGTFNLNNDQTFYMRLACVYGFKSWLARTAHLIVGAAAGAAVERAIEHGPQFFAKIAAIFH